MNQRELTYNLQYFAETEQNGAGAAGGEAGQGTQQPQGTQQGANAAAFDYDKLANIISGKQSVAEDTVLKNFFKQKGMSKEEMEKAISTFKEEKARNQPDVEGLKKQAAEAQKAAHQAIVEKEAVMEALALGLDVPAIPYLIRLTDLSEAIGEDGEVDKEALKKALNTVLEDVPQLKPGKEENKGFQIGSGGDGGKNQASEDALKQAFGL